ncbi:MAG: thiamine pyrophosphate-dependent enzyme [Pseudobdellovibrio sp.]
MNVTTFELYKRMLEIRLTEEHIQKHYIHNDIKTPVHLANGAEAIPCGILPFFAKRRVYGTYRSHHWYLETTRDTQSLFLELLGKQKAPCQGRAGSMHLSFPEKGMILTSAVVSTTIPIALGDCWAGLQNKKDEQTIVFFGDGALEEGVFWETLNFASLKKIPLLFVCEDNDLAIHSMKNSRQAFDLKKTISSYQVPYYFAEAFHVEEITKLMPDVSNSLREGPVFLHLKYFRQLEHVGVGEDFQFQYREKPVNVATDLDPLWNARKRLISESHTAENLDQMKEEIKNKIDSIYNNAMSEEPAQLEFLRQHVVRD